MRILVYINFCLFTISHCYAHHITADTLFWSSPAAWSQGQVPKPGATVTIPANKTIVLDITPPPLLSINIEGQLIIGQQPDLRLSVAQIIIGKNATFQVGTEASPFPYHFTLHLLDRLGAANGIKVYAGGRCQMVSSQSLTSRNTISFSSTAPKSADRSPDHLIQLQANGHSGIQVLPGGQLQLSGIAGIGLGGITRSDFAIKVEGQNPLQQTASYIRHCTFRHTSSGVIQLDKTQGFTVEKTLFQVMYGPAVQCSPSGIGHSNRIHHNVIANCHLPLGANVGAIQLFHPGQSIYHNKVIATTHGSAFRFDVPPAYDQFNWTTSSSEFVFRDNTAQGYTNKDASSQGSETAALYVGPFKHRHQWRFQNNHLEGFPVGIWNQSKNLFFDSTLVVNCSSGIIPGGAGFVHTQINHHTTNRPSQTSVPKVAILADGHRGVNAPIFSKVNIAGYPVHLLCRGAITPSHDFDELTFDRPPVIHFEDFPPQQQLRFRNTDLYPTPTTSHCHPTPPHRASPVAVLTTPPNEQNTPETHEHHHHQHILKQDVNWVVLPPASPWRPADCQTIGHGAASVCPATHFGRLTLSTGQGLDDPIHEHERYFDQLAIRIPGEDWVPITTPNNNRISVELPANYVYEVRWANTNTLTDISCEWEGLPGSSIELGFSYPFPYPIGLRSFGQQLPATELLPGFDLPEETGFAYDQEKQIAHVKIVPEGNHDEVVIYTPNSFTEIKIQEEAIPMDIYVQPNKNSIALAYDLPQPANVKLELLDYFGNTRAVLVDQQESAGSHKVAIPFSSYPLSTALFFYALEVDGQRHKGPIYWKE